LLQTDYEIVDNKETGEVLNVLNRKYGAVVFEAVHLDKDAGY